MPRRLQLQDALGGIENRHSALSSRARAQPRATVWHVCSLTTRNRRLSPQGGGR
jgi:hypothetical protein